jgi:hypothetical protein
MWYIEEKENEDWLLNSLAKDHRSHRRCQGELRVVARQCGDKYDRKERSAQSHEEAPLIIKEPCVAAERCKGVTGADRRSTPQ